MANAGTVNVNLVAQTAAFHAAMEKAEGALGSFANLARHAGEIAAAFLGYEALKTGAEWIHQTMEAVEHQRRLATSLGITSEAMVTLSYSATLAGSSGEQLGAAMLKMEEHLSGVGGESAKVKGALEAMGLSMRDLQGKSGDEQLAIIADGMKNVASSGDRAKIGMDLFGKSYATVLPMLSQGSEAIREQAREAKALGLVYSEVDAAKIEAANISLKKAGEAIQGGLVQATKELSPLIEGVVNYFLDLVKQSGGFGAVASAAMEYVVKGIGVAADALNVLQLGWYAVKSAVYAVAIGVLELVEDGVRNFLTLGQIVGNFGMAVGDTAHAIGADFDVAWQQIKGAGATAIQFMGKQFAGLLDTIADGLRAYSDTAADAVMTAAGKVRAATGTMVGDSQKVIAAAKAESDAAFQIMQNSWSSIGQTSGIDQNPLVKMLKDYRVAATQYGGDAASDFMKSWSKVLNQEGSTTFNAFYANLQKASQRNAEQEAAIKRQQLEDDKVIAAQRLAVDTGLANKIRDGLNQARVVEETNYQNRLKDLKRYHDEALLSDAEFQQAEAQAKLDHEVALASIHKSEAEKQAEWDKRSQADQLSAAGEMFGNLASLMHSHNKKAFELGKAAAYAQAIVNTAAGIARQFADLPIYLAWAAAAAVAVAGAVQISTIASTQFDSGGGGGGGSVGGGFSSSPTSNAGGSPVGPTLTTPGMRNSQAAPVIQFVLSGINDDDIYTGKAFRKMLQGLNDAQANGSPVATVGTL